MKEVTLNLKEGYPYTKLQKLWIKQLKTYPERQMRGSMGKGTPDKYKACCLGEGVLCIHRIEGKELPFKKNNFNKLLLFNDIRINDKDDAIWRNDFPSPSQAKKLGLFSINGELMHKEILPENHWALISGTLSSANDSGITSWTEIAELMEQYPEVVFNNQTK